MSRMEFILQIVRALATPIALVLIVAIPWNLLHKWYATHLKQMEMYTEMTQTLLAVKVSMEHGHPAGAAVLQGIGRVKEARKEPELLNKIEEATKPTSGMVIKQGV